MPFSFRLQSSPENELPEELPIGSQVIFQGEGAVEAQKIKDQHDGSRKVLSMVKIVSLEVKRSEHGILQEAPIFKDMVSHKSPSKKLRDRLFILYQMEGSGEDFDMVYYPKTIEKILSWVDKKINDAQLMGK